MEKIKSDDGSTIAIIVRKAFNNEGINFLSECNAPLQVGINSYKKGCKLKGHIHKRREILVETIQEVIYFKRGGALVKLYDLNMKLVKSVDLSEGDLIFFVDGGHGFEMSEDTTFVEVKQGPYLGKDKDKEFIE